MSISTAHTHNPKRRWVLRNLEICNCHTIDNCAVTVRPGGFDRHVVLALVSNVNRQARVLVSAAQLRPVRQIQLAAETIRVLRGLAAATLPLRRMGLSRRTVRHPRETLHPSGVA